MSEILKRTEELLKEYDFKLYEIDGSLEDGSIIITINKGYFNIFIQLETSNHIDFDFLQSWIQIENNEIDLYGNAIWELNLDVLEQEIIELSDVYSEKMVTFKKLNKLITLLNEIDLPIDFIKDYIGDNYVGNE